ncbi:MAG: ABC transporter substrate-binding protein [Lachnospiraceae bacterium]
MKKKVLSLVLTSAMVMAMMSGCGAEKETVYKVGVIQQMQHDALDAANEGFIQALDDAGIPYEVDQQNAAGETSSYVTIADKFVNDDVDLILAIATNAAQAVAGATSDIPILGTAITDYETAGLVASNDAPGGNVSGTSDMNPIDVQLELISTLVPDAETLCVFYSSDEDNSILQADLFEEAAVAQGFAVERYTISNTNEIETVMQSMEGKVDAVYIPTDNKLAAAMPTVGMLAEEMLLPVFCGEGNMVTSGGLATYGLDYYELGYTTGEMAVEVLVNGADTATMPITYLPTERFELIVNEDMAEALGIDLSVLE